MVSGLHEKHLQKQKQILRLTTPRLKSAPGAPFAQDDKHSCDANGRLGTLKGGEQGSQEQEAGDAGEEDQGHADAGLAVDFGDEVSGGDVDGYARGDGQTIGEPGGDKFNDKDAGECGSGEGDGRVESGGAAASAGEHDGGHGEAFRGLVEQDGEEDENAEPAGDDEAGADGDAVEEGVDAEAGHDGVAGVAGDEFAMVGLFAEVEVGVDGVFEEMHHAVAGHDEDGAEARVEADAFGHHFEQGGGDEEACAEGDEVAEVAVDAFGADEDQAANDVGEGGDGAEE